MSSQNCYSSLLLKDKTDLNFNAIVLYFLFAFDIFKVFIVENVKYTKGEGMVY